MPEAVVDANVLLRYLTDEPHDLAERAVAILEGAEGKHIRLTVASLTIAEVVYVLESVYHWPRSDISRHLLDLVSAGVVDCVEQDIVTRALSWYRDIGQIHFADAYIAALALEQGDRLVISFDRELRRVPGLTLIQDTSQLPRRRREQ